MGYANEPPTLDPLAPGGASAATRDVLRPVLPSLFKLNERLRPQPDLVAAWPSGGDIRRDPFSVVLRLRRASWSDGVPITAKDVRFSHAKLRAGPTGYRYAHLRDVDVLGPRTLRLRFDAPVRRWWALFSIDDMILPEHSYSSDWSKGPSVSGGPFTFVSWTRGLSVRLDGNRHYWGPKALVAGIEVVFVPDEQTRLQLLVREDLDAGSFDGDVNIGRRARAHGFPPKAGPLDGTGGASGAWGPSWWELAFDPGRLGLPLAKALVEAIDPSLAAEIVEDSAAPADGIPASFPVGPGRLSGPWGGRGDLDEAKSVLSGGRRRFQLAYPRGDTSSGIAAFVHFTLKDLGVVAELAGLDSDVFERSWLPDGGRAPVMLRLRRGADAPDAAAYGQASGQLGAGLSDELVARVETAGPSGGQPARAATGLDRSSWAAAQRRLRETATVAPLVRVRTWIVGRPGVAGPHALGAASGPLWNAADWRVA